MYSNQDYIEAGGLMFYGPNAADMFRQSATFVDKILRKAGDVPGRHQLASDGNHNGYCCCRPLRSANSEVAGRVNEIDVEPDQFGRQGGQSFELAMGIAVLD